MDYERLKNMSSDFEKIFDVKVSDITDINIKKQIEKLNYDLSNIKDKIIM